MRASSPARRFALPGRSKTLLGLADADQDLLETLGKLAHSGELIGWDG